MDFLKIAGAAVLALAELFILFFAFRTGKPFKTVIINAAAGIFSLIIINLTSHFTGVHIPINGITVTGTSLYGLPAVFGFLVFPLIFK